MSVIFHIPSGPKNLAPLFPAVDFSQVDEYFLELNASGTVLATTNRFTRGCCCTVETLRVFFVNYLGGVDAINLAIVTKETDIKSTRWKKANTWPLNRWDGGWQRSGITGTRTVLGETDCYSEKDQVWLEELKATPNAWLQWKAAQGQPDDYIPIIIEDGQFVTRKDTERYSYPFQLQFTVSNEIFTLRN